LASALVVVAVSSCGSNPAGVAGSGAANLPPQNNPAIADKDKKDGDATRRSLSGSIIDALSGQAVERAIVVVEEVQSTVISTPIPATQAPSPESSAQGGGGGAAGIPKTGKKPYDFKKGGRVSASSRADGCAVRGKTKGRMV
jgi:hypothetical protein